jgi:GGDEF domain-containing protein
MDYHYHARLTRRGRELLAKDVVEGGRVSARRRPSGLGGIAQAEQRRCVTAGAGWEFFYVAVDDHSLAHQANHDVLMGPPNRAMLEDQLEQSLTNSVRGGWKIALMTIDVDHFKRVNDTFRHLVGDEGLPAFRLV